MKQIKIIWLTVFIKIIYDFYSNLKNIKSKILYNFGQHRYFAIKDLVEKHKYKNQLVTIEIVKVNTLDELRVNFEIINKNTKMPRFPKDLNKSIIEKVCGKIFEKYPDFWSDSSRPQKPNINQTYFQEGMAFLFKELNIFFGRELSESELLKIILDTILVRIITNVIILIKYARHTKLEFTK